MEDTYRPTGKNQTDKQLFMNELDDFERKLGGGNSNSTRALTFSEPKNNSMNGGVRRGGESAGPLPPHLRPGPGLVLVPSKNGKTIEQVEKEKALAQEKTEVVESLNALDEFDRLHGLT